MIFIVVCLHFYSPISYAQDRKLIDQSAPEFELTDLNGNKYSSTDEKGKILVLDFWATWCAPCIRVFPAMIEVQNRYLNEPDVVFWYINTLEVEGRSSVEISVFLQKKGLDIHVLKDEGGAVAEKFGVTGLPVKILIDKSGIIRYIDSGYKGDRKVLVDQLTTQIEMLR